MNTCIHCGTAFRPKSENDKFCCKGCECVHDLIHEQGFDRFYDLRNNESITPVKGRAFECPEFEWLAKATKEAEEQSKGTGQPAQLDCSLEGLSCVACIWLVERLFEQQPGAIRAISNPAQGNLHLEWQAGECDLNKFAKELVSFGYTPTQANKDKVNRDSNGLAMRTGLCFAFALNAMGFTLPSYLGMPKDFEFAGLFQLITFLSATLSMLIGSGWFVSRAWRSLRIGTIHIDLPIALGLISAYIGSIIGWIGNHEDLIYFDFVCTFAFLMLGGRWIQTLAVERNRRRIALRSPIDDHLRYKDADIALSDIRSGDLFEWQPGKALPVSSCLIEENADISLEWIRGEADPINVSAGSTLPAGAILLGRNAVNLRALEAWSESLLSRLTAQESLERGSPGLQRLLRIYLVSVISIGFVGFAAWAAMGDTVRGMQAMISVFVVSCPCALGIAIPLADERAVKFASRYGAFVREMSLWPRLLRIRKIVFDKTGTLTLERPVLDNPECLDQLDDESVTALAQLTSGSIHPVSRCLLESLGSRGQKLLGLTNDHGDLEETPGMGVALRSHGSTWSLGKSGWVINGDPGATILTRNGNLIAQFHTRDAIRPDAKKAIRWADSHNFSTHILSGDHPAKVAAFASGIGIQSAHGGLSPDDKARLLSEIDDEDTLYLGDGANDSLAFDKAYVTGTPVADRSLLERKADFFTLNSSLNWLPELFTIAKARRIGIIRAFTFALSYNVCAVSICLAGFMNPLLAAILMPLSSITSIGMIGTAKLANRKNPSQPDVDPDSQPWRNPVNLHNASTSAS